MFNETDKWHGILNEFRKLHIYYPSKITERISIERVVDDYLISRDL